MWFLILGLIISKYSIKSALIPFSIKFSWIAKAAELWPPPVPHDDMKTLFSTFSFILFCSSSFLLIVNKIFSYSPYNNIYLFYYLYENFIS